MLRYLIDARPVLVGLLQEPCEGRMLPLLAENGAWDGDVAVHGGDQRTKVETSSMSKEHVAVVARWMMEC